MTRDSHDLPLLLTQPKHRPRSRKVRSRAGTGRPMHAQVRVTPRLSDPGMLRAPWLSRSLPTLCAAGSSRTARATRAPSSSSARRATSRGASSCLRSTTSPGAARCPAGFAVVGVARREKSDESFRAEMKEAVSSSSRGASPSTRPSGPTSSGASATCAGHVERPGHVRALCASTSSALDAERGTAREPPLLPRRPARRVRPHRRGAPRIAASLPRRAASARAGPGRASSSRSRSATTSRAPGRSTTPSASAFDESQVFRIDHYLGKETVQNLLVFRFANSLFEPVWGREHVDHVQITVAEDIGVEGRGQVLRADRASRATSSRTT